MRTAAILAIPCVAASMVACNVLVDFGDDPYLSSDASLDAPIDRPDVTPSSGDAHATVDASVDSGVDAALDSGGPSNDASPTDGSVVDACSTSADFYVGRSGSCSYATITSAIGAARASTAANRAVHVAPGTYDKAAGEIFPFDLRGGISLLGEGSAATDVVVSGYGSLDHTVAGGDVGVANVTLVVGAIDAVSRISNVRILSGDAVESSMALGVYCDSGNAVAGSASQPAPNLVVDGVVFDHGYQSALVIGSSTYPKSGCNARVVSSSFHGGWAQFTWYGVTAGVCDGTSSPAETAIQLGDGTTAHANAFNDIGKGDGTAGAVHLGSCGAFARLDGNNFATGEGGVIVERSAPDGHVVIASNTFTQQANAGLQLALGASIDALTANTFSGCAGAGVWTSGGAKVLAARSNVFSANQSGVSIVDDPVTGNLDFGVAGSPGNNVFRCNSGNAGTDGDVGYDFAQLVATVDGGGVSAYGNAWDHAPPSSTTSTSTNGADLVVPNSGAPPIVGGAILSTATCPTGYTEGP